LTIVNSRLPLRNTEAVSTQHDDCTTRCATGAKRRRQFTLVSLNSKHPNLTEWVSKYNLDGRVDPQIQRSVMALLMGHYNGRTVAVKHLKCYSP